MLPGETTLTLLKSKKMEANPVGRREVPCRSPRGLEREHYERWTTAKPSLVDRPVYTTPTDILRWPGDDSGHGLAPRDGRVEEASSTSDADDPSVAVGVGATTEVASDDSDDNDDGDGACDICDALDDTEAATECFETCSNDVGNGSCINCDVSDPAETDLGDMVVNSHVTPREPSLSCDEDPRTRPKRREATTMVLSMDSDAVAELDATFESAMHVSVAEETQGPAEGDIRMSTQRLTRG
ncbi:hypothetical protein PC116_g24327 [Phytophthora cactorum]|nr:hypothetical protein PC116_g24327 [Phytophthora cactorum]